MLVMTARAQLTNLDTTTIYTTTNVTTSSITIPGVVTNGAATNTKTNSVTVGESLHQTQLDINGNWAWLNNWIATNPPPSGLTNFWLNGVVIGLSAANTFSSAGSAAIGSIVSANAPTNSTLLTLMTNIAATVGGPGGSAGTNYLTITNGVGSNLTISNTFTLTSTNPFYPITSLGGISFPAPTNCPDGWYSVDGFHFTNDCGQSALILNPASSTNTAGPYFAAPGIGAGVVTNANGMAMLTNGIAGYTNFFPVTCTNSAGPFWFWTNNLYTNACGFVLSSNMTVTTFTNPYPTICTNAGPPYFAATNLGTGLFTNACGFILTSTNPACTNGLPPYLLWTNNLYTNACGFVSVSNKVFNPGCTNMAPPYYLNTNIAANAYTNACGFINYSNAIYLPGCTNIAGPYILDTNIPPVVNQYGTNFLSLIYTNACGFVMGGPTCPNNSGPFYPSPQWGLGSFTNACGEVLKLAAMSTNYNWQVSSIIVTNPTGNRSSVFLPIDTAYLIYTNSTLTNQYSYITCWALYNSNAWWFYYALTNNVTILPLTNETITLTGSVGASPYVTNVTMIPPSNTWFAISNNANWIGYGLIGNPYSQVMFTTTNTSWWYIGPNGAIYGTPPGSYQFTYVIEAPATNPPPYTPTPGTNSPPPPVPPPANCPPYISFTLNGVCKTLANGYGMWQAVDQARRMFNDNPIQITVPPPTIPPTIGQKPALPPNRLEIHTDGSVSEIINNRCITSFGWSDTTQWISTEIQGECETCKTRSFYGSVTFY